METVFVWSCDLLMPWVCRRLGICNLPSKFQGQLRSLGGARGTCGSNESSLGQEHGASKCWRGGGGEREREGARGRESRREEREMITETLIIMGLLDYCINRAFTVYHLIDLMKGLNEVATNCSHSWLHLCQLVISCIQLMPRQLNDIEWHCLLWP